MLCVRPDLRDNLQADIITSIVFTIEKGKEAIIIMSRCSMTRNNSNNVLCRKSIPRDQGWETSSVNYYSETVNYSVWWGEETKWTEVS
jgi:hypothetical protein